MTTTLPADVRAVLKALWDAPEQWLTSTQIIEAAKLLPGAEEFILRRLQGMHLVLSFFDRPPRPAGQLVRYGLTNEGITFMEQQVAVDSGSVVKPTHL